MHRRKLALTTIVIGSLAWSVVAAAAASAASISANWAGYIATPARRTESGFSSVSGSWREPTVTCSTGAQKFSAVWVGLGGDSQDARALEQIGTDADCSRSGAATYDSWYELLPSGPVDLKMAVHPGDQMTASVTVEGDAVTLRIRDLTTGEDFARTKHVARIDTSSAEWIVEAPAACATSADCAILPLADFGEVAFSDASAIIRSHTGPIADPRWSATTIELVQSSTGSGGRIAGFAPTRALISATPTVSSSTDGAFSVNWQEQSARSETPAMLAPAASSGAPRGPV